jgi:hypothetical protein
MHIALETHVVKYGQMICIASASPNKIIRVHNSCKVTAILATDIIEIICNMKRGVISIKKAETFLTISVVGASMNR